MFRLIGLSILTISFIMIVDFLLNTWATDLTIKLLVGKMSFAASGLTTWLMVKHGT